ncbi:hypothetical protein TRP8649_02185 [Pelagimonas phthalicica]|uniref:Methyltransferase FkbM domain-containing protein n=1 Tax=Pelagimonas phthalicica TaxID=1037362 RepID=A0A238JDM7_9RHOB|nr:FkbM family methyltransferase [Pelagimonas phthalicica]TDS91025.1 FkbM family methyltransferase [Pelagimonas phthalicica]SMX28072.1 hypothetical protein TRP8649_02185 [Pelagimonas phthalicica]
MKQIVDVGMCEGNDTDFYLKKGFKVLSIEALPSNADQARKRFKKELKSGQLEIMQAAATETAGEDVTLWVNPHNPGGNMVLPQEVAEKRGESITVKSTNWQDIVSKVGEVYYCKIDIERQEIPFLRSFTVETRPKYISAECYFFEIVEYLHHQLGYTKFKFVNQTILFNFKAPNPALEGNYVENHVFQHASGFFGKEVPGPKWCDFDEIREVWETINHIKTYETVMWPGNFFDIHATT